MLLEEEHTVTSLTSPETTSPGDAARRARATAGSLGRAAAAGGWPHRGEAALAPLHPQPEGPGSTCHPPRSDPGVTAGSLGHIGGPGSTVPARARLHTASRRHSTAGKCRLLPGCTRSTSPSDTCARARRQGSGHGALRDNCPRDRAKHCAPGCRGHAGAPSPQGNPPSRTQPSVGRNRDGDASLACSRLLGYSCPHAP